MIHFTGFALAGALLVTSLSHANPVIVQYTDAGYLSRDTWSSRDPSQMEKIQQVFMDDRCVFQLYQELKHVEPVFYNRAKCADSDRFFLLELQQESHGSAFNRIQLSVRCGSEANIFLGPVSDAYEESSVKVCHASDYVNSMLKYFHQSAEMKKKYPQGLIASLGYSAPVRVKYTEHHRKQRDETWSSAKPSELWKIQEALASDSCASQLVEDFRALKTADSSLGPCAHSEQFYLIELSDSGEVHVSGRCNFEQETLQGSPAKVFYESQANSCHASSYIESSRKNATR